MFLCAYNYKPGADLGGGERNSAPLPDFNFCGPKFRHRSDSNAQWAAPHLQTIVKSTVTNWTVISKDVRVLNLLWYEKSLELCVQIKRDFHY